MDDELYEDVRLWPHGPLVPQACTTNAASIATVLSGYRFIVGCATYEGIVFVPHAWVARDDVGYEVTWPAVGSEYVGREEDPHTFAAQLAKGALADAFENARRVLRVLSSRAGL